MLTTRFAHENIDEPAIDLGQIGEGPIWAPWTNVWLEDRWTADTHPLSRDRLGRPLAPLSPPMQGSGGNIEEDIARLDLNGGMSLLT